MGRNEIIKYETEQLQKIANSIEITEKILREKNWEPLTVEEWAKAINIMEPYFEKGFVKFTDILNDYFEKQLSSITHRTFRALKGVYGGYGAKVGKEGRKQMETDEQIDDFEDKLFT